ncbi:MAG: DEAD/DEAH box helicase [Flavobacteriaceae bacterium]|nr:MAG: DEAD/DEAH box helicase [Flavobacteriaceae bacterium]
MNSFKSSGLNPEIVRAVEELGFLTPTPIQEKSLALLIDEPCDLLATAQTGTGKTAAFGLPILHHINPDQKDVQAIILCPTRELCIQIEKELVNYSKYLKINTLAVYGGTSIDTQIRGLGKGIQIVVGTPGRTLDLINRRKLKIENIRWAVLDEADEMLSMGFKDDLDEILSTTPKERTTLLFSATLPSGITKIANTYMNSPEEIHIASRNKSSDNVTHQYFLADRNSRYPILKRVVDFNPDIYAIIFCRTRRETQELADKLTQDGYSIDCLHGDLSQAQRDHVMGKFRSKKLQLLVATDVAARGIDVDILTHVINYNLPDEIETYVHRSGRTGRASNKGICYSIITASEKRKIKQAEKIISKTIEQVAIPTGEEVCQRQLLTLIDKIQAIEIDPQIEPFMEEINQRLEDMSKEELLKKMVSIEFTKFLTYYSKTKDLNPSSEKRDSQSRNRGDFDRFFLNVGSIEGISPTNIIGLINDSMGGKKLDIGEIEIMKSFSFFEVESGYKEEIIKNLSGESFKGQTLNVEETKKKKTESSGKEKNRSRRNDSFGGKDFKSSQDRTSRGGFSKNKPKSSYGEASRERGGSDKYGSAGSGRRRIRK